MSLHTTHIGTPEDAIRDALDASLREVVRLDGVDPQRDLAAG